MLFGGATNVLGFLASMSSSPTALLGAGAAGQGAFDLAAAAEGQGTNAQATASGSAGAGGSWWSSPGTMNALLTAQGQSGVGASTMTGFNQPFTTLDPLTDPSAAQGGLTNPGGFLAGLEGSQGFGDPTGAAQTTTNPDGTTTVTYPDGSIFTLPAASADTSATPGAGFAPTSPTIAPTTYAANLLDNLIARQTQMFTVGQSLSTMA